MERVREKGGLVRPREALADGEIIFPPSFSWEIIVRY